MTSDPEELVLGTLSLITSGLSILAQAAVPDAWTSVLTQFGGLGLAVWLVIHHTTITIPRMQKDYKDERLEMLKEFENALVEKRQAYHAEIARQREEFADSLKLNICQYRKDNKM